MGYQLVRDCVPTKVAEIVLTHHERFDGGGYPDGISGPKLLIEARILQVADAFDAITSLRPYQPALPVDYAIDEMIRCTGTQFDPDAVTAIVTLAERLDWRSAFFGSATTTPSEIAV
jgi:HD-GYP domain-containing protein (c-di-GMP phosphodiesterase class II)